MFRRVKLAEFERAIAWRTNGQVRWLRSGAHWLLGFGWKVHVVRAGERVCPLWASLPVERLSRLPEARSEVTFVHLAPHERALVWADGRLEHVLGAGMTALFVLLHRVRVEVQDARSLVLDPGVPVETALALDPLRLALVDTDVPAGSTGFLFLDERFVAELPPGRYATWKNAGRTRFVLVPRGPASFVHLVKEAWTRDLATVEAELVVTYRVNDARAFAESFGRAQASLRFGAETALRGVLATTTHARALGDTTSVELAVESALASLVPEKVLSILGVHIRRRRLVRRMPRPRFRGFGDRGRDVALALRDFATRPRVSESASGRRH